MPEAIDAWTEMHRSEVREAAATFRSGTGYPDLIRDALDRGYEPAPLWMLEAPLGAYADKLFPWRGGVWIK